MKALDIFRKTMTFVWMRLGIDLAISAGVILWTIIWIVIAGALHNGIAYLLALVAVVSSVKIVGIIQQYIGYMIKSAQIAVIAEAFRNGNVPDNMVAFGKERVKTKFAEANTYILLDKLVSGSVRQINKAVNTSISFLENLIPQAEFIGNILRKFTTLTLTYVDECCLCYSFMKDDQSAFQSAADGVVIYFQNWKTLLKSSAKGTGIALIVEFVAGLIVFLIMLAASKLVSASLGWLIALVAAICIVVSLRDAFLGSYMMIYTMENFNREVQTGSISVDLYGKLCGMSKKFRELLDKAGANAAVQPAAAGNIPVTVPAESSAETCYCAGCGAKLAAGVRFCPSCGKEKS